MTAAGFPKSLVVFNGLLLLLVLSTTAIPGCPPECDCSTFVSDQTVDCIGKELSEIPQSWPSGTLHILLTDNLLTEVTDNDFTNEALTHIVTLYLDHNNIEFLNENAFKNLERLRKLYLGFNRLTYFPTSVLENLLTLTELTLPGNDFSNFTFSANSLCGTDKSKPSLEILELWQCQLTDSSLAENAFAGCYLDILNLSSNNLTKVTRNQLDGIDHFPDRVNLSSNRITTIYEDSGFQQFQLACSLSRDQNKFLIIGDNPYCCNADMMWMRNFSACAANNPSCHESNSKLFSYKLENSTQMQCQLDGFSTDDRMNLILEIAIPCGVGFVVIVVIVGIVYKKKRGPNGGISDQENSLLPSTDPSDVYDRIIPQASEVKKKDVIIEDTQLGHGGYGVVQKGKYHGMTVAVKTWFSRPDQKGVEDNFRREVQALGSLRHHRIVAIIGYCFEADPPFIITEFMVKGSAVDVLRTGLLQLAHKLQMLYDCAVGMKFLHRKKFLHMDLKAANLLVDDKYRVKVGDFGLAHRMEVDADYTAASDAGLSSSYDGSCGRSVGDCTRFASVAWSAPERLNGSTFSKRSDVYSFGVVMWEFMVVIKPCKKPRKGEPDPLPRPFDDIRHSDTRQEQSKVKDAIISGRRPGNLPKSVEKDIKTLMSECWDEDPQSRPTFEIVVEKLNTIATTRKLRLERDTEEHLTAPGIPVEGRPERSNSIAFQMTGSYGSVKENA